MAINYKDIVIVQAPHTDKDVRVTGVGVHEFADLIEPLPTYHRPKFIDYEDGEIFVLQEEAKCRAKLRSPILLHVRHVADSPFFRPCARCFRDDG